MADSMFSHPDLPSFQVVAPRKDFSLDDFKLPDGTPLRGPDSLLIPGARDFSSILNSGTRVYSYRFDEAMRDNMVAARAMRRDAFIRGLLEERILPTINRRWQIEVPDAADPDQRYVQDELTKIVDAIPDFDVYKRALLDGVWYGRAGVQQSYARDDRLNNQWGVSKWEPVHGDSVQFTFDGVPAILMDGMTAGWYAARGATRGPWGDIRSTDRGGMALVLNRPYWRDRFVIHQHIREKADFFEGELAGSVQGLGLRGLVYWQYVVRTEALTWMLAYMQSVGQMDMLIFNFPWGNDAAKKQQEANANKVIGKAAIVCPRNPAGNWPAVEQLSMNDAGLKALHDLVAEYFDRHIERLIVGQSMSAGLGGPGGLEGDGRSEFAKETKDEILIYDTNRLDTVLSRDLLKPLLRYNFKWAKFKVSFKSVLPNLEGPQKVEAGTMLIQSGIAVKVDEMREAAGFGRPEDGDEIVGGMPPMMPGMGGDPNAPPPDQGGGVPPGGDPNAGQLPPAGPVEFPGGGPPMPFSGGGRGLVRYGQPADNYGMNTQPTRYNGSFAPAGHFKVQDATDWSVLADYLADHNDPRERLARSPHTPESALDAVLPDPHRSLSARMQSRAVRMANHTFPNGTELSLHQYGDALPVHIKWQMPRGQIAAPVRDVMAPDELAGWVNQFPPEHAEAIRASAARNTPDDRRIGLRPFDLAAPPEAPPPDPQQYARTPYGTADEIGPAFNGEFAKLGASLGAPDADHFGAQNHFGYLHRVARGDTDLAHDLATHMLYGDGGESPLAKDYDPTRPIFPKFKAVAGFAVKKLVDRRDKMSRSKKFGGTFTDVGLNADGGGDATTPEMLPAAHRSARRGPGRPPSPDAVVDAGRRRAADRNAREGVARRGRNAEAPDAEIVDSILAHVDRHGAAAVNDLLRFTQTPAATLRRAIDGGVRRGLLTATPVRVNRFGPPRLVVGRAQRPEQYDAGPAPAPAASPAMGYPGGGNTYIPSFGGGKRKPKRDDIVEFIRYADDTGGMETAPVTPVFKVRPPKKLYRGTGTGGKGNGIYSLGKGLYTSPSRAFAARHGKVTTHDPIDVFPRNPLHLTNLSGGAQGAFYDWLLKASGHRRMSEFNAEYPDPGEFVRSQGFDGVVAGDEVVRYLPPPESEQYQRVPIRYAADLVTDMGKAVKKFTPEQMDGIRVWVNKDKQRVWIDVMDWGDGDIGTALVAAAEKLVGKDAVERVNEGMVPDGKRGWTDVLDKIDYARPTAPTPYKGPPHKFASTQVNLTGIAAIRLLAMAHAIPDDVLCEAEGGRELDCHITARYGLHGNDPAAVARLVRGFGPIRLRLGGVSVFPGGDGKAFDVVKVDVTSPDLVRLNKLLAKLPHTQTHPTYHPHCTLGYVKKGWGARVAAMFPPLNLDWVCDALEFGDRAGNKSVIPLTTAVASRRPAGARK